MIASLIRRDPAFRTLPKFLVVGTMTTSVIAGVQAWYHGARALGDDSADLSGWPNAALTILALWLPVALYLALGRTGQRGTRMDVTLPLEARRLWIVHHVAVLLSGAVVLAASAAVVAGYQSLVRYRSAYESGVETLILPALVAFVVTVVVMQATSPAVYRVPPGRAGIRTLSSLLGFLVVTGGLAAAAPFVSWLVLAVAAAAAFAVARTVPPGFTLVPLAPGDSGPAPGDAAAWGERSPRARERGIARALRVWKIVLRTLIAGVPPGTMFRIPAAPFGAPFVVLLGVILGGGLFPDWIRYTHITITVYMLLALVTGPVAQLYVFDALPLDRRRLFAWIVFPGLLLTAAGYGIGFVVSTESRRAETLIAFQKEHREDLVPPYPMETAMVRVPVEVCRVARDGRPPAISSPWGETHEPWSIPLHRGSRAVLYSPFSTPEGSSSEFVALQISRALQAVHGMEVSPAEIERRYLELDADGSVVATEGGLNLTRDHPGLTPPGEGPVFPIVMMLTAVLWLATVAVYFSVHRATVSHRARLGVYFGLLGVVMVLHLTQFAAFITRFIKDWVAVGLFKKLLIAVGRATPGGYVGVSIVCLLIFTASYLAARAVFVRAELSKPPEKCVT